MGYDCVALSHGTGGHLADETDEFFQQLVNHAGGPSYDAIAFLCLNSVLSSIYLNLEKNSGLLFFLLFAVVQSNPQPTTHIQAPNPRNLARISVLQASNWRGPKQLKFQVPRKF